MEASGPARSAAHLRSGGACLGRTSARAGRTSDGSSIARQVLAYVGDAELGVERQQRAERLDRPGDVDGLGCALAQHVIRYPERLVAGVYGTRCPPTGSG
jgi:hypothetical protein